MKGYQSFLRVAATVIFFTIVGFVPLPYVLEHSVPAKKASDFVEVTGKKESGQGQVLITAVGVSNARVFTALLALLPDYSLEPEVDYVVPDDYYEKHDKASEQENDTMTSSQLNALQVAYRAANRPVEVQQKDIYVSSVNSNSSFREHLQRGDRILKVNNQTYSNPYELVDKLEKKAVGALITIEYSRKGILHTASGHLVVNKSSGKPSLGVELYSEVSLLLNPSISLKSNGVEGPSGGLMFSLEIYNQLSSKDIAKGRIIAGTGTIDHKGNVGRISGVEKKVIAADRAGASIFFVPDDTIDSDIVRLNPKLRTNYHEAVRAAIKIKSQMTIVPVKTFDDALLYLQKLP